MRKIIVCLCIGILPFSLWAEAPKVPRTITFAGLTLKLNEKAQSKIQAEVNALTKHPKYFQIKVDRLQIYFPIIERVFKEEGLPEDFKYLSLQESALISDAISSSNAIGYWQFKKAAATEVGLRIDRNVDERKNIVSSTRGAAKYIKKNNRLYFDNWVHALLAYQQGPGGAMKLVSKKYRGARTMPINGQTHWYVIKFLAHKIAFGQVQSAPPKLFLAEFYEGQEQTIKQIAQNKRLSLDLVQDYNKWLQRGKVPSDKPYAVILPYAKAHTTPVAQQATRNYRSQTASQRTINAPNAVSATAKRYQTQQARYPQVYGARAGVRASKLAKINGISGIVVGGNDDLDAISSTTGVTVERLLYYNDVPRKRALQNGALWYLKPKKSKAKETYHIVEDGETLWDVSQRYGIKLTKLRSKNRIGKRQQVKPGRVLWLRHIRPADEPVAYQAEKEQEPKKVEASTKSTEEPPLIKKNAPPKATPIDTVKSEEIIRKQTKVADATPVRTKVEAPVLEEEEEFTLEEPVNFVGVDKSENVTKISKKVHVVQAGETLYAIGQKYQVSVAELQKLNQLSGSAGLSVGQELIVSELVSQNDVPKESKQSTDNEYNYHEVQPGETLYQIARDNQATIKELMEWNNKSDFSIAVGEQLKLKRRP